MSEGISVVNDTTVVGRPSSAPKRTAGRSSTYSTSTNPEQDGSFRKLVIKVADKNLKVQVRKGYYAIKPERG